MDVMVIKYRMSVRVISNLVMLLLVFVLYCRIILLKMFKFYIGDKDCLLIN